MALHPVIAAALASAASEDLQPYNAMPIAQARAQARLPYLNDRPPVPVSAVRNVVVPGPGGALAVRIYTPAGEGPHPVMVFFQGSGFVVLDLDSHDELCRRLCRGASCVVASVDYRLAPEYPFPAAPDDCLAATRWVAANAAEFGGDATRLAVCGDSAGACLAAVTALRIRDEGGPALRAQLLFYPVTDHHSAAHASYQSCGTGYGLTLEGMRWFWNQYLPDPDLVNLSHAAPLRAESLAGLPSAYVDIAEYDVLRDEGEAFARRLEQAGVPTVLRRSAGMNHGFLKYAAVIPEAALAIDSACTWLRSAWLDAQPDLLSVR